MILKLIRRKVTKDATLGELLVEDDFECYTLEDLPRKTKVKGETCIPKGTYQIKFREVETPMTKRYRDKYPWFNWHLEVCDVPNFTNVYIHIGNNKNHTDGCILVGQTQDVKESFIGHSMFAFKALYSKVRQDLENGVDVLLVVEGS